MSNLVNFPQDGSIRERAVEWIVRLDRGLSDEERVEFRRWAADERHRTELFVIANLWDRMDVLHEIAGLLSLAEPRPMSRFRPAVLLAVSVAVFAAVGLWVLSNTLGDVTSFTARVFGAKQFTSEYRTEFGALRTIALPDGSTVTLNTDSKLRVRFSSKDRRLELEKGEAHFKVAKDAQRVFIVSARENEFRAVGTAFNVRVDSPRGVELTVTEGRVQVTAPASLNGSKVTMVEAGRGMTIGQVVQDVKRLDEAQLEAATAWQQGIIIFNGEPLEKAVQEVSRYTNVRFVIAEESIKRQPVTGYFKTGDIDALIMALRINFDIRASREGQLIVLSRQTSQTEK